MENNTKTEQPLADAFGMEETQEVEKTQEQKEEKKYEPIPEDHPIIVALKQQVEDVKREYGSNLSGQREVINRLEKEIKALRSGEKTETTSEEGELLFTDIKYSKDLSEEEREEMTDTEIKQMDEIAKLKEVQNALYQKLQKKEKEEVEDKQSFVRSAAMEIAKAENGGEENIELANQIIESVKQFNLEGLSKEELRERVEKARRLLPDYTPPKEPIKKHGGTVKGDLPDSDPFGIDKIIEEATRDSDGTYSL